MNGEHSKQLPLRCVNLIPALGRGRRRTAEIHGRSLAQPPSPIQEILRRDSFSLCAFPNPDRSAGPVTKSLNARAGRSMVRAAGIVRRIDVIDPERPFAADLDYGKSVGPSVVMHRL